MLISSRPVSRRATLAAAPVLLVAGCRWGPAEESPAAPEKDAAETVPDADQVKAAVDAISEVNQTVKEIAKRQPRLSKPLSDLSSMHDAHLGLLLRDGDEVTTLTLAGKRGFAPALKEVHRLEATLQATLSGLAADVSSGTLARTLAAMAAGVAQHRQLLPASRKGSDA